MKKEKISLDLKPISSLTVYYFLTRGLLIALILSSVFFLTSLPISSLLFNPQNPFSLYNSILAATLWILFGISISLFLSIFYSNSLRKSFRLKIIGNCLYYKGGVFFKKEILIPLDSLGSVEASQNFLEKLLGFFSLRIYFSNKTLKFPGVEKGLELASFILEFKD